MLNYRPQFLIPSNEQDFEELCADVYGTIFNCTVPSKYGRRGQAQYGLDLIIYQNDINSDNTRIGIQCKHVQKLTFNGNQGDSFIKELERAEKGQEKISKFILATSLPSDARLLDEVNKLSQQRIVDGKFPVEIHFANDLEHRINSSRGLSDRYLLSKTYESLLQTAEKFINREQYSVAINMLDKATIKLMNQREKFKAFTLLAIAYLSIDNFDEFFNYLAILEDFNWDDDNLTNLKIVRISIQKGRDNAESELDRLLKIFPTNLNLIGLKTVYDIQKGADISFEKLDERLKKNYDIQFSFMEHYINFGRNDFESFHKIYGNLTADDKIRPSALIYKLNAELLEYYIQQDKTDKIRKSLDDFRANTSLENIEKPSFKDLALNAMLNAYAMLDNFENSKHWYEYAVENKIELNQYAIHNLVVLCIKHNNKSFFHELLERYSCQNFDRYFIDGLFDFNDIEKIHLILQENKDLASGIQNELRSYLMLKNELEQQVSIDEYIDKYHLLEVNSARGLALIGFSLFNKDENLFNKFNQKILEISNVADPIEYMYLGSYFFSTKQFEKSIECYQKVLELDFNLHEYDVISCLSALIETNRFAKAKSFILENWDAVKERKLQFFNEIARLGYLIQDLSLVEQYLNNLTEYSNSAWYWRNRLQILITNKQNKKLKQQLRIVPIDLKSEKHNTCWIIIQEIIYGQKDKALLRLLNYWRENPDDLEVLQDLQDVFKEMIENPQVASKLSKDSNPFFDTRFHKTIDGCYIEVKVNNEHKGFYIDSKVSSNDQNKFINPLDSFGSQFLGKAVGDIFNVSTPFGNFDYELLQIKSIPLAIFHDNLALANQPNNPFNMLLLKVDTDSEEGIKEFLETINRLSTPNHAIENKFEAYINNPMTVALLGEVLHKDIAELTYSWIQDFRYPLYTNDDRYTKDLTKSEAKKQLESNANFTVDLFTLLELKRINAFDCLENIDNLVVSSFLMENLRILIYKHNFDFEINQKHETVGTFDSKFVFYETDVSILKKRSDDLKYVINFLEDNAEIVPAYGNDFQSDIQKMVQQRLPEIDKSTLRLSQQYDLNFISLDARLRAFASQVNVRTISSNDFLEIYLENDKEKFKDIKLNQFFDNRWPVELNLQDLIKYSVRSSSSLNKTINIYLNFLCAKLDLATILKRFKIIINKHIRLGYTVTYGYLIRLCEIVFCLLAKYEKLDFEKDKKIANEYYSKMYKSIAISADNFEELKSLKDNTLEINYGPLSPRLVAKNLAQ